MQTPNFRTCTLLSSLLLCIIPALAQQEGQANPVQSAGASKSAQKTFSQQDLDQLLAPIALYPDSLLAQILMASTYPLEVVQAERWVKTNSGVTGKKLEEAMLKQSWDPAVKSLTSVPQVLKQMSEKLEWTQKLGDAFLAQQPEVMATVQQLRAKAYAQGNLKSTEQQVVKTEVQKTETVYIIQSAKPEVIYVPTYSPSVVYGTWWYSSPPYYVYPPAYVYPPGLTFAAGVVVGAAIWGNCNWGHSHSYVNVNVSHYNSFNRTTISNTSWNHNVKHRRGVSYMDQNVAKQYQRNEPVAKNKADIKSPARVNSIQSAPGKMDPVELDNRPGSSDVRSLSSPNQGFENGARPDFSNRGGGGASGGRGGGIRDRN